LGIRPLVRCGIRRVAPFPIRVLGMKKPLGITRSGWKRKRPAEASLV
jgi:hypothetical protein